MARGLSRVLDASALLAYVNREPGWERVADALDGALIGAVNWTEVAQRVLDLGTDVRVLRRELQSYGLRISDFTAAQAEAAAALRGPTRAFGLSLGDRACLALGFERGGRVMTADRVWAQLDLGLAIEMIR